jgi:hypothetical protein
MIQKKLTKADAALMRKDFKPVLAKHYNALPKGERNSKLLALYAASTECLGCKNGADALELLTLSERIQGFCLRFLFAVFGRFLC